jgi:pimeloyl-ACP methyl ester carboxylesterase
MSKDFPSSILFLPGLLNDRDLWKHQIAALADTYDMRVADLTRGESIAAMAADALEVFAGRFVLCGLSMGGYVALEIMRQAPERVAALILMDTSARADTPEQSRRRADFLRMAATGRFRGVTPRLLPSLISRTSLANEDVTGTVLAMAERMGRDVYIRQQTAIMARIDSLPSLAEISCPTLILVGEEDSVTPVPVAREMAALIHGSRMEIIKESGHLPPLEAPSVVTRLIKLFLKEQCNT